MDRIIRWSDNDQTWSRFTYDEQGRCVTVTGAEGYYNATLDYGDGCTSVTDGKGTHRYYYDPDGNILREAAPDGSTTTYEWDEFHHLLARHSPAGRGEKFEYNAAPVSGPAMGDEDPSCVEGSDGPPVDALCQ